jgi:hypothetical protein
MDNACGRAILFAGCLRKANDGKSTGGLLMDRQQLEHVLRAAGSITGSREIVILGSQAILGAFPHAPSSLLVSMEADVYPLDDPDKADLIDGCIGELSPFHETFGYYAHGIGPETATLPRDWRVRLVRIETPNTGGTTGYCLSPVDLAVSKLLAGREKDIAFVRTLLEVQLLAESAVAEVAQELTPEQTTLLRARLARCLLNQAD